MIRKAIGRGKSIAHVNGKMIASSRGLIRFDSIAGVQDGWRVETLLSRRVSCTLDNK